MADPLSSAAFDRIRRLVRVLHRHEVDPDELVLITVAGIVLAIEARTYRDPLVIHQVLGAGPHAEWPLPWADGFLVLGIVSPPSGPRLHGGPDDTPGAVPVMVIGRDRVEVTFIVHEDLPHEVLS